MKKKILIVSISLIFILACTFFFLSWNFLQPFIHFKSYLLGENQPTSYLILLGNDTEARANGGFAGSYVKITLSSPPSTISEIKSDISFHDIYVPNGQLLGSYVKPPEPIQQAFGHGTWELANADWNPNFPTASTSIRWFLEKGKEINPDILGVINLSTIKKTLNLIGPVAISEKSISLSPDNLYLYLQGQAELNFFPGSTQKADALHSVGTATLKKFNSLNVLSKLKIAKLLYLDLKNQNIVLHSSNSEFQKFLVSHNFAGEYKSNSYDQYGLVETNLGANKANAYVTRHTTHNISVIPGTDPESSSPKIIHKVNIQFQNTSPEANPNPPLHYGGNYIAYLRIYLPLNATDIEVTHSEVATDSAGFSPDVLNNQKVSVVPSTDPEPARPAGGSIQISSNFTEIGFWHITLAGNTSQVNLSYTLPLDNEKDYSLTVLKQNGFPASPQTLNIFDKSLTTSLTSPFTFP